MHKSRITPDASLLYENIDDSRKTYLKHSPNLQGRIFLHGSIPSYHPNSRKICDEQACFGQSSDGGIENRNRRESLEVDICSKGSPGVRHHRAIAVDEFQAEGEPYAIEAQFYNGCGD